MSAQWRPYGTGKTATEGPVRLDVYMRGGRFVCDVKWLSRWASCSPRSFEQTWHDDEEAAKRHAEKTAADWIEAEIAGLREALDALRGEA